MIRPGPVRPTHTGWLVLQTAGLLLLVGLFKAINLLTLLGFLLLAACLVNLVLVLRQPIGLTLRRRLPRPLVVGTPAMIEVRLTSTTTTKRLGLLIVDEGPPEQPTALVPRLVGRQAVDLRLTWTPTQRGRQSFGPVVAIARYPFGLIERRCPLLPTEEAIVWPALGEIERGKLSRQLQRRQHRQPARSRPRPERTAQQEIYGLRPYRTGDSSRLIHWRTSARRGELMVREYEDVPPESLTIVLDGTTRCPRELLEQAVTFVATLCWEWCRHRGERLVLAIAAAESAVLAGTTGPELGTELLDLLAVAEPGQNGQGLAVLQPLGREVSRRDGVLLVSGGPSDLEDALRRDLGLNVLALTADDLNHLDGYAPPLL